jgi:hypothetical protein
MNTTIAEQMVEFWSVRCLARRSPHFAAAEGLVIFAHDNGSSRFAGDWFEQYLD